MMKKLHYPLLLLIFLAAACASLSPPLVSLEASLNNPDQVTIYKAPT